MPLDSRLLDRVAVRDSPQLEDAGKVGSGNIQASVASPGCDQKLGVAHLLSFLQLDLMDNNVHVRGGVAHELNLVVPVPLLRADKPSGERFLAPQVRLGEGWAAERR